MKIEIKTLLFGNLSLECEAEAQVTFSFMHADSTREVPILRLLRVDLQVATLRNEIASRFSVRSAEQIVLVCNGKAIADREKISVLTGLYHKYQGSSPILANFNRKSIL